MNNTSAPAKTVLSWSSGKDSAWALHLLRPRADIDVVGLLTTVSAVAGTETESRVAVHRVRETLLERQADAVGLPLWRVTIPDPCPNREYEAAPGAALAQLSADGVEAIAFGDLFLEDVRRYREARLAGSGLMPLFPLWGLPTDALARAMVAAGLRATLTRVDTRRLPAALAGRRFDAALLADLPPGADPCGERGEFHTFVHDGPMFARPVRVRPGDIIERDGFAYADLLPM